jgi:cyclic beta-1,2-glucan synthetase
MDFSRQPGHEGDRGVIVRAYMAHHQGMGFLALTNFVHGNPIQRRFHARNVRFSLATEAM